MCSVLRLATIITPDDLNLIDLPFWVPEVSHSIQIQRHKADLFTIIHTYNCNRKDLIGSVVQWSVRLSLQALAVGVRECFCGW